MILLFCPDTTFAKSDYFDTDCKTAETIAYEFASNRHSNLFNWRTEPLFNSDEELVAFSITFSKNKHTNTFKDELLVAMNSNLINRNEDSYITVIVSNIKELPPVIAFHEGLPAYFFALSHYLKNEEINSLRINDASIKMYYSDPFTSFLNVDYRHSSKLFNTKNLREISHELIPPLVKPSKIIAKNNLDEWESLFVEREERGESNGNYAIINGVPDFSQPYYLRMAYSPGGICFASASACVFEYWDKRGYPKLNPAENQDYLIEEFSKLYYAQKKAPTTCWETISNTRAGYNFEMLGYQKFTFLYGRPDNLSSYKREIDYKTPVIIITYHPSPWTSEGSGHAVVGVGYQDNFIIVHDNWQSTPREYYVNWGAITLGYYVGIHPDHKVGDISIIKKGKMGKVKVLQNKYAIYYPPIIKNKRYFKSSIRVSIYLSKNKIIDAKDKKIKEEELMLNAGEVRQLKRIFINTGSLEAKCKRFVLFEVGQYHHQDSITEKSLLNNKDCTKFVVLKNRKK